MIHILLLASILCTYGVDVCDPGNVANTANQYFANAVPDNSDGITEACCVIMCFSDTQGLITREYARDVTAASDAGLVRNKCPQLTCDIGVWNFDPNCEKCPYCPCAEQCWDSSIITGTYNWDTEQCEYVNQCPAELTTECNDVDAVCCDGFAKANECVALEGGCAAADILTQPVLCAAVMQDCPNDGTTDETGSMNPNECCRYDACCSKSCDGNKYTGYVEEITSSGGVSTTCKYYDGDIEYVPCQVDEQTTTGEPSQPQACQAVDCCYVTCENNGRIIRGDFTPYQCTTTPCNGGTCDTQNALEECEETCASDECCGILCDDGSIIPGEYISSTASTGCVYAAQTKCGCETDDALACSDRISINRRDNCEFDADDCCDDYTCPATSANPGLKLYGKGQIVTCVTQPCYPTCELIDTKPCCSKECSDELTITGILNSADQCVSEDVSSGVLGNTPIACPDDTPSTSAATTNQVCVPSDAAFIVEAGICEFCFQGREQKKFCRKLARKLDAVGNALDEIDFTCDGCEWIMDVIGAVKSEAQCFLDYCISESNGRLPLGCTLSTVRLKKGRKLIDDCACDIIECDEPVSGNNVVRFGVLVGFGFIVAVVLWM